MSLKETMVVVKVFFTLYISSWVFLLSFVLLIFLLVETHDEWKNVNIKSNPTFYSTAFVAGFLCICDAGFSFGLLVVDMVSIEQHRSIGFVHDISNKFVARHKDFLYAILFIRVLQLCLPTVILLFVYLFFICNKLYHQYCNPDAWCPTIKHAFTSSLPA